RTVLRGLPFAFGTRSAPHRWLLVGDGLAIDLRGHGPASHLVVAHFADSWRDPAGERPPGMPVGWVLPTGESLARYEIRLAGGTNRTVGRPPPVRIAR